MKIEPFFSIVIANYNYGHLLSTAIESILHQNCEDYEIILVDGGSSDNSLEIINKYEKYFAWWISEPDNGQSDAFNKGFSHAKGQFLTWLNADDVLLPGTLSAVKKKLVKHKNVQWATGNFVRFLHSNNQICEAPWGPHILPKWLQGKNRTLVVFGPTTFWSKKAYETLGPIDEKLHYVMDIDYWQRLNQNGYKQIRINHYCWGFRMHENSKTAEFGTHKKNKMAKITMKEEKKYINEKNNYHPSKIWRIIGLIMRIIDGSHIKAIINRKTIVGKEITNVFNITYHI